MATADFTTKLCTLCNQALPMACFYHSATAADGRLQWCKDCRRRHKAKWRDENRSAVKAYERQRKRDPKKQAAAQKKFREANRETCNARTKASREKKLDYYRAKMRGHKKAFPERVRADDAKRRARLVNAPGSGWTATDVAAIKLTQKGKCAICREVLQKRFHRDHIMPLKLGGAHDRKNLQLLCGPCNMSKGARHPIDHARTLGLLLWPPEPSCPNSPSTPASQSPRPRWPRHTAIHWSAPFNSCGSRMSA